MDRGAWQAIVCGCNDLNTTEVTYHACILNSALNLCVCVSGSLFSLQFLYHIPQLSLFFQFCVWGEGTLQSWALAFTVRPN